MKYVFPIIWNLITLGFVWGVLSQLSYNDELQTIAALIMLAYANLLNQMISSARLNLATSLSTFENLALIIKNQGDEDKAEDLLSDIKNINGQIQKKNGEYYVNLVGLAVIWVSCVFVILGNF